MTRRSAPISSRPTVLQGSISSSAARAWATCLPTPRAPMPWRPSRPWTPCPTPPPEEVGRQGDGLARLFGKRRPEPPGWPMPPIYSWPLFLMPKRDADTARIVPNNLDLETELFGGPPTGDHEERLLAARDRCRRAHVLHWPLAFAQVFAKGGLRLRPGQSALGGASSSRKRSFSPPAMLKLPQPRTRPSAAAASNGWPRECWPNTCIRSWPSRIRDQQNGGVAAAEKRLFAEFIEGPARGPKQSAALLT